MHIDHKFLIRNTNHVQKYLFLSKKEKRKNKKKKEEKEIP